MRAVRMIAPNQKLELQEIPMPQAGPDDVVVKIKAAGICHSDAHYRKGISAVEPLPLTLGHEVAGIIETIGSNITDFKPGDRVAVHYLATCGSCRYCTDGYEQFCPEGSMIGKYRDGGYAEYILMPGRSIFHLPDEIPFEQGAIMMCSSSTSYHALHKARLKTGGTVAIFGIGGLGISAVQLAQAMGASDVFAVDINPQRLALGGKLGAIPINASESDPVEQIRNATEGRGVDVALELIGLVQTIRQSVQVLAYQGRTALAGICPKEVPVDSYRELIAKEAEIIGVSDHLASEMPQLIEYGRSGKLNLEDAITETIPLDADKINQVLDRLDEFGEGVRTVIVP